MNANQNRVKRTIGFGATLLLAAVMVTGCGGENNSNANTSEPVTAPATNADKPADTAPIDPPAVDPPQYIAPLTGLAQDTEAKNRPIAVMVNNFSAARPQSGLPNADVVWEVLAEGGITRLVAVFQSYTGSDPIGPIRSNRPYLIRIGDGYNAILAHAGASQQGYDILQHHGKDYLDEISNAGAYFYRESFRKAPHNLYSNLEKLRAGAAKKKYKDTVHIPTFQWSETGATESGNPASKVVIHFLLKDYKLSYIYNPSTELYDRFINDKPHTDLTTNNQLKAANLVIIGAKHKTYDDYGRLEVDLESGGPAMLFELGKKIDAAWERGSDGAIRIMKDGKELPFVPGHTFYHIVPMTPTFEGHVEIAAE
ncbi:Protein of unknown function (DUF3048) [Paenibacillus taihuensis]|uniref:DUF3048 family protein n=1 Tax=Paenibacillus taihuensis TaxID=1156355 RepID=A0A3D9SND4_9BACL|nr:DUF3048 domain-containing protein [Paenibacillus taihuensis]REE90599.1 Protein of unknown function (DUF3048) [Paenibacillus taihuensis]